MSRTTPSAQVTVADLCHAIESGKIAARVRGRSYAISLKDYLRFATRATTERRIQVAVR